MFEGPETVDALEMTLSWPRKAEHEADDGGIRGNPESGRTRPLFDD